LNRTINKTQTSYFRLMFLLIFLKYN